MKNLKLLNNQDWHALATKIRARGLASWPDLAEEYQSQLSEFRKQLKNQKSPHIVEYPQYRLKVELQAFFEPLLSFLISIGDYELTDLELYDLYVEKGDRVLDVGGGIGLTAAYCYRKSENQVTVIEPDNKMHAVINRTAILNNASFELISGCVVPEKLKARSARFFIHQEFWRSTATPTALEQYREESVTAYSLNDLLERFKPTVLVLDVEGAEKELFKDQLDFLPSKIFVEIHVPNISERQSAQVISSVCRHGYELKDFRGWMFYFEKAGKRGI